MSVQRIWPTVKPVFPLKLLVTVQNHNKLSSLANI